MKQQILNSKGEPIKLNAREAALAASLQRRFDSEIRNALGYEIDITTLTSISKRVVEQKFFEIPIFDYVPIRVGEGAWSSEILTYRSFALGGDFSEGVVNTGSNDSRLASVSTGVDSIRVPVKNWAKQISWTFMELQQAARAGNWDVVTALETARKKDWDLGVQRVAFLGLQGNANVKGLLTQDDVTANTSLITAKISTMTASQFAAFVAAIIGAYRTNANYTAMPNVFIMPESDYTGMIAPVSETYPNVTKLSYLLGAFQAITMNQNFKILPLAYANQAQNADVSGLNKNRYTLMRYDDDTIRMDIPVDYTNTLQNTINGFHFQNVGYGQFTGVQAYRPQEVIYFDWAA